MLIQSVKFNAEKYQVEPYAIIIFVGKKWSNIENSTWFNLIALSWIQVDKNIFL